MMQPDAFQQPARPGIYNRFVLLAGGSFVLMAILAGPARMYLSMMGLSPLIYLPNLMMLIAIVIHLVKEPYEKGFSALRLIALLIPVFAILVGVQFTSLTQVLMGAYVLVPFLFGVVCAHVFLENIVRGRRFVRLLWLLVVSGIVANQFIEFPWEGFGYNVGNLDVDGSRQWYASGGKKRVAGFARASFDAAAQVQILAILLAVQVRSGWVRLIIWGVSIYAIIPTNSKGILLVAAVLTPIILLRARLPETPLRVLPVLFGSLALALPASTLLFSFNSQFNHPTLANLTFSFYDRLNRMWPEAWSLLAEHGNFLLGRGVGGIGTAQTYFESALINAGDNLFMYWFVIFGWAALPGFIVLLLKTLRIRPHASARDFLMYCLLMAILVYGSMTNIVENAVLAVVCGIVVRWLCSVSQLQLLAAAPVIYSNQCADIHA